MEQLSIDNISLCRALQPGCDHLISAWAWTLTVVLAIISIALNAISLIAGNIAAIVSIAISGIVLYYMYRPHVKAYFGKTVTSSGPSSAAEA